MDKINYLENKKNQTIDDVDSTNLKMMNLMTIHEFTLGKSVNKFIRNYAAGNIENFKKDLKKDLDALDNLFINLQNLRHGLKGN